MQFKRRLWNALLKWKNKDQRKPLVLRGARQVGKTTLVQEFSGLYKHQVLLNLERPKDLRYFEDFTEVELLLDHLFLKKSIPWSERSETLLFIDEIQESPKAIALLRYFYEDLPELNVIAAGSLLEHALSQVKSFPVGRVEFLYLHPLNFEEFLMAQEHTGALKALREYRSHLHAHTLLKELFHEYAIIGGMPEVVKNYITNKAFSDLPPVYESIWTAYRDDVEKYAKNTSEAKVIKHLMRTAALQLDERVKLENFGNSNYKWREVKEAMHSLGDARLIQLIHATTSLTPPLLPDLRKHPRIQILDTGLVNHQLKIQAQLLSIEDLSQDYKGRLIPHLVTQELLSLQQYYHELPSFWVRNKAQSSAEVDLVLHHQQFLIPIEIKSGKTGTLKSLHQFIDACPHHFAVRIYGGEYSVEQHITPIGKKNYLLMNLPYFLVTQLSEHLDHFIKNEALTD